MYPVNLVNLVNPVPINEAPHERQVELTPVAPPSTPAYCSLDIYFRSNSEKPQTIARALRLAVKLRYRA